MLLKECVKLRGDLYAEGLSAPCVSSDATIDDQEWRPAQWCDENGDPNAPEDELVYLLIEMGENQFFIGYSADFDFL